MNRIQYIAAFAMGMQLITGCAKQDYKGKEFYKQEAYIIASESTSATERDISNLPAHSFVDTIKYKDLQYNSDTIRAKGTFVAQVKFKVGIGGSLPAAEDMKIVVGFDSSELTDYNILKNTGKYIPGPSLYTTNIPYNNQEQGFVVNIPKGTSSSSLIFSVPLKRDSVAKYDSFAFPLKILRADKVPLSRQFTSFLIAGLLVDTGIVVNWQGFPIPKLPRGTYYSVMVAGNASENSNDGILRTHKYITPLDTADNPALNDKYMIWGTAAWSFDYYGFHSVGWMYNKLTLLDKDFGLYQLDPILPGNNDFPYYTFQYATEQKSSYDNFYDPRLKQLTIHYKNVIGNDYTDVLTFVSPDFTLQPSAYWASPQSWEQVRARGYKYWLPL
ncbi:DUF1735 domain-containing protein [Niabella sp. CC-SYL272]|uniref:DUF1735 domain-containing protein n=1 Tax=Niabella agricola TaxID=2891571 RepID=UPI001F35A51A|nr:DUF1735 domain-containing protein [Niabella agricola]MCF3109366.1 DUF1735 domain-containing protein [Niabella agricola]